MIALLERLLPLWIRPSVGAEGLAAGHGSGEGPRIGLSDAVLPPCCAA